MHARVLLYSLISITTYNQCVLCSTLSEGPEDSSSSEPWTLTDVADQHQLATAERLARKDTLRSKLCTLCHIIIQWYMYIIYNNYASE